MKRIFLTTLLMLATSSAFALDNKSSLVDLLSQYDNKDSISGCQVSFNAANDVFSITGGKNRDSLSKKIESIKNDGSALILTYGSYDGTAEVTILRTFSSLKFFMTWVDNEMGRDKSTFCEIYLKN